MGGTRFLIQAVFAVEFFIVLGLALYGGILSNHSDLLTVVVFQQRGRGILSTLYKTSSLLNSERSQSLLKEYLPPTVLMCQESQVVFWKDILMNAKQPNDRVEAKGDGATGMVSKFCENPELLLDPSNHNIADLIACEFWIPKDRARLVVAGGTVVFYSRSIGKRIEDMRALYPMEPMVDCLDSDVAISLVLAVDSQRVAQDWKEWTESLQGALSSYQSSWRGLVRSRKNPLNFSVQILNAAHALKSSFHNNQTVQYLDGSSIDEIFGAPRSDHLQIVLYLPSYDSILLGGVEDDAYPKSQMITQGSRFVGILSSSTRPPKNTDTTKDTLARQALSDASDWIARQCMGIPGGDTIDEESLDGSVPRWYSKIWWQRSLLELYDKAVHKAQRQAKTWKEMSYRSPLSSEIVKRFGKDVLSQLEKVPALLANQSFSSALIVLEETIDQLEDWESDDTFMPPLDFPPEQYAAIFAPLVVPLMLPLLVGLFREYRRYLELKQKKKDKDQKVE